MTTQADLMRKGYKAGIDMCIHCAETENLTLIPSIAPDLFGPGDKYCPKHYDEVRHWFQRVLGVNE